ncbi:MAG: porphobilinogen synthase, partial [Candidatus Thermoplasmatota archaeon]|nr:porphobilinogen synthase [Candidatus Thermoplasmatota archaeon]
MRINRWTSGRREMLNGHALTSGLVQGHFVVDGQGIDEPIPSLPGIHRQSVDVLRQRIAED